MTDCCKQLREALRTIENAAARPIEGEYFEDRLLAIERLVLEARAALSAEGECPHKAEAERFRAGIREVFEISDCFGPRQELPRWAKDDLQAILDGKPVGAGVRARLTNPPPAKEEKV